MEQCQCWRHNKPEHLPETIWTFQNRYPELNELRGSSSPQARPCPPSLLQGLQAAGWSRETKDKDRVLESHGNWTWPCKLPATDCKPVSRSPQASASWFKNRDNIHHKALQSFVPSDCCKVKSRLVAIKEHFKVEGNENTTLIPTLIVFHRSHLVIIFW